MPPPTKQPVLKFEQADARGEVYSITLPDGRELMLIHSLPGAVRGGHSHVVPEVVLMLTGSMEHRKNYRTSETEETMLAGATYFNHPGEVHMGEFFEDCWLVEWRLGTDRTNVNYAPWRELVNASAAR